MDLKILSQKIKELEKKNNVKEFFSYFFDELKKIEKKGDFEKLLYISLFNNISFYKLNSKIYEIKKDEKVLKKILNKIIEDTKDLERIEKEKKFLEELKENKEIFIEKDLLIIFTESDFGKYLILITPGDLRTFNLYHLKNGYHIYDNGSFCSGNTYAQLKEILEKGYFSDFIFLLIGILTEYDDGKYHLAKKTEFNRWKEIIEEKKLEKEEKLYILELLKTKEKYILDLSFVKKASNKCKNFVKDKIAEAEDFILSLKTV